MLGVARTIRSPFNSDTKPGKPPDRESRRENIKNYEKEHRYVLGKKAGVLVPLLPDFARATPDQVGTKKGTLSYSEIELNNSQSYAKKLYSP